MPKDKKKRRIHGSYLGREQYMEQLDAAEIPKYQKRKIEQELRKKRKKRQQERGN
jgi:hypothetical protein